MAKQNSKLLQIKDFRQSQQWEEYLKTLKWKTHRTSYDALIVYRLSGLGNLFKIQRPGALNNDQVTELHQFCKKNQAGYIKFEPSADQNIGVLTSAKYSKTYYPHIPTKTMYINLSLGENALFEKLSKSAKYSVNRAQRENARYEIYSNPTNEQLKNFYDLYAESGKYKNYFVEPFKDTQTKRDIFKEQFFVSFVYDEKNNLCGTQCFLVFKNNVWFVMGGTSKIGRKNKTGYHLMWKSITHFSQLNYDCLDFEGLDDDRFPTFTKGWGGFSHFKEKFNGEVLEFPPPYARCYKLILRMAHSLSKGLPL